MAPSPIPLSVVVLTYNEERNLPACLESLAGWTTDIVVVDSGSTDGTAAIARAHGATLLTHPFRTHARQWAWALAEARVKTDWILALDADQQVSPELRASLERLFTPPNQPTAAGYFINRRQVFRGRWIRHGGYYPKYLLKLFNRSAVGVDQTDLVDHHFSVRGPTATLSGDLIEANSKEDTISDWIAKHNRYAKLQAAEEIDRVKRGAPAGRAGGNPDERVLWMKHVWRRLPPYVRPTAYFFYRYVLRLGFLDGKEGFIFHFLQAWWYRLLVDINLDELKEKR